MKIFTSIIAILTLVANVAFAEDRRVAFTNQSKATVTHIYGSNIDESSWQEDILGSRVLAPDETVTINFYDGTNHCLYDIKIVLSNSNVLYKHKVNVCLETHLYIH